MLRLVVLGLTAGAVSAKSKTEAMIDDALDKYANKMGKWTGLRANAELEQQLRRDLDEVENVDVMDMENDVDLDALVDESAEAANHRYLFDSMDLSAPPTTEHSWAPVSWETTTHPPTGAWDEMTHPPTGAWDEMTYPPTGAWDEMTHPPTGAWDEMTHPPTGDWGEDSWGEYTTPPSSYYTHPPSTEYGMYSSPPTSNTFRHLLADEEDFEFADADNENEHRLLQDAGADALQQRRTRLLERVNRWIPAPFLAAGTTCTFKGGACLRDVAGYETGCRLQMTAGGAPSPRQHRKELELLSMLDDHGLNNAELAVAIEESRSPMRTGSVEPLAENASEADTSKFTVAVEKVVYFTEEVSRNAQAQDAGGAVRKRMPVASAECTVFKDGAPMASPVPCFFSRVFKPSDGIRATTRAPAAGEQFSLLADFGGDHVMGECTQDA